MDAGTDAELRGRLDQLLRCGMETHWRERACSSEAITAVQRRLRQFPPDDYAKKLELAGFTPLPYVSLQDHELEQSCATCMYFERSRGYCGLPVLQLPVKPEWSCVLWRI